MQDLPSSLMQSNNYYLIDSTTTNNNNCNSNPSSNNSVNNSDIDIIDTDCGVNINLTNFVFTHPNYCDNSFYPPSFSLMSTPNQQENNDGNNNKNNNAALEIPSFLQDLSNQSNQSIQSNISSVSSISNTSNNTLPRLQAAATYNTSVSSTISIAPTIQMYDSNTLICIDENDIVTIQTMPRALISYILSFLSSVQVIKISIINLQFYAAIKDEGAAFEKLDATFWNKIFNSMYHPTDITYFKRFKAVKHVQIITGQLKDFIQHRLISTKDNNNEEKKEDGDNDDDVQIADKSMTDGVNPYYGVFWSCFNRLEKLEFTLNTNDNRYNHNELILNSLQIISQQQIKANNFTVKELILHNVCVGNELFDIFKNMKILNILRLIGNITFERDTFGDNLWLFNNFDRLRMDIYHIDNVQLLFKNMHFIPYLFILLFYHKNIKSLSYEFQESHIMDSHNLMSLNDEYIKIILQKCAASEQLKQLHITPHLFCDVDDDDEDEDDNMNRTESMSLMIEQMFYYHKFASLQVLKVGDWNGETWISFVSDYDYKKSMQFIINHYQTLSILEFNNNIGAYHGYDERNSSLLNASIWEPLNFLYNIYTKNYQFDIDNTLDETSKNKLQLWCNNTLKSFKFQIGETDNTLNELIDEHKDEMDEMDDNDIYLEQFNFAKYEWLNDIKSKIPLLIEYFKENNISHSIELSFVGGNQVSIAQKIFSNYFNNQQSDSKSNIMVHHNILDMDNDDLTFTNDYQY